MFDMDELVKKGFKIKDGILYDRYGSCIDGGPVKVREFGWGAPGTQYHFDHCRLSNFSIEKEVHYDEWYLKNQYQKICRLRYLGGLNWEKYDM